MYMYIYTYTYTYICARLSGNDELRVFPQSASDEHRVDETQPVARGHAQRVLELGGRRAGAALWWEFVG